VESFSKKVSGHVAEEEYRRFWKKNDYQITDWSVKN